MRRLAVAFTDVLLVMSGAFAAQALARPVDGSSAARTLLDVWAFAPFALLPEPLGEDLLALALVAVALAGVVAAILAFGPPERPARVLLLTAAVASQPFAYDARSASFVGAVLLGAAAAGHAVMHRGSGSLLLGGLLLVLRPALVAPFVGVAFVLLAARRRVLGIAALALGLAAPVAAAVALDPGALAGLGSFDPRARASLLPWSGPADGPSLSWAVPFAVAALACAALAVWWAPADTRPRAALAVSLVVWPFALPHDALLLVPTLAVAVHAASRIGGRTYAVAAASSALVLVVGTWADVLTGRALPFPPVAVLPLVAIGLLAAAFGAVKWSWRRERDTARMRLQELMRAR
ncbi:MAG TPA: hypothetical protein VFM93_04315 [Candidatus Limnocylindria bacterium]|nr:hypothetical protein [Candidatus Limnocylindria bacterium]